MQHSKGSAALPTTLAETIIYTKYFFGSATIVVGTLGFLPALHRNQWQRTITQRLNAEVYAMQGINSLKWMMRGDTHQSEEIFF
jgi:uncharacterized membrane protein HdeD (DUF308 family)